MSAFSDELEKLFEAAKARVKELLTGKAADEVHADVSDLFDQVKAQAENLGNQAVSDAKSDAATVGKDAEDVLETVDPANNQVPTTVAEPSDPAAGAGNVSGSQVPPTA
jgi:vacuolar-type H+-ATPase subunit H